MIKPGEGGINPETWTKDSVKKLKRQYNERHGIPTQERKELTPGEKRARTWAKRRAKRKKHPLRPDIPKLAGPRIPVGSIIEAVKPYADFYGVNPYQLATDAARKITYKYPSLSSVVRIWDTISATEKKKKLSLDWIVENVGMSRDEFKALILTVLREEAIEKAQDLQIVNMAKLTEKSLELSQLPTDWASKERIKHLEKHGVLLPPPKSTGVVVNTNVTQQTANLPSMDDWARQITEKPEPKQLPEADLNNVIEVETVDEGELVPA